MCADIPDQNPQDGLIDKTSWPINSSTLKSPPPWLANAATTIAVLLVVIFLFLAAVAVVRLATDLLGSDAQRASEAVRSFLPIAAAVVGLPLIIWRLLILTQQTQISDAKTQIDRETYYTSIFAKSVELMGFVREAKSVGADGNEITRSIPNIESRLGALYSLERLLAESIRDQRTIIETLCAYVRENSPLEIPEGDAEAQQLFRGKNPPSATHRADVQAALTIIGRRPECVRVRAATENWRLDLRGSNLISYDFSHLNFERADFDNSFLNAANLIGGRFEWCYFRGVFFRSADLTNASFRNSTFSHCDVTKSKIASTDFRSATLIEIDLRNANVASIDIRGTNLEKAFSSSLDYMLEFAKNNEFTGSAAIEFGSLLQLFQKAAADDKTLVSQAVRDILIMMGFKRTQQA